MLKVLAGRQHNRNVARHPKPKHMLGVVRHPRRVAVAPSGIDLVHIRKLPVQQGVCRHFWAANQNAGFFGNLAAGGKGVAQPLTEREWEIARALGPVLAARGLLLVGLDVIGDCLTEINVTSPTCFREIMDQTGFDVAARFLDALEQI